MLKYILSIVWLISVSSSMAQENDGPTIDELNRQLENPLSRFWSLIFQENMYFNTGEFIDGTQFSNVFNFGTQDGYETGFGDMQVFSLYGPDKKDGVIWGAGLTFIFPTASSENLGSGKVSMGPAVMVLSITKKWTIGGIIQQWNSIGGDPDQPETNQMDIQYIIRKQIQGKGMSIGMGPNISINWNAPEGNRLTFPIGLGITKTVKWGKTPWKLRLEPQYSIIKPENYGARWNIRIQVAPIIKNPFF
jgi:hypothetical protein